MAQVAVVVVVKTDQVQRVDQESSSCALQQFQQIRFCL
jgi:hypothetical protein